MIIERAFLRLLDMLPRPSRISQHEVTLAGHLAKAVLMELQARNALMVETTIDLEHAYPLWSMEHHPGHRRRADLYVHLQHVYGSLLPYMFVSGYMRENWVEAKFFRKNASRLTDTEGAAILRDLLRLCAFVWERSSSEPWEGRYLLLLLAGKFPPPQEGCVRPKPPQSLAWLEPVVSFGRGKLRVQLSDLSSTFRKAVGPGFPALAEFVLTMDVVTYAIEPDTCPTGERDFAYWAYLSRVASFSLRLGQEELAWPNISDPLSQNLYPLQRRMAQCLLALLDTSE